VSVGLLGDVGAKVRRLRMDRGLSPAQLGWRVGMTGRMVAAVEEGRHALLSLQDVERIADALGVATWDLLDSGPPKQG